MSIWKFTEIKKTIEDDADLITMNEGKTPFNLVKSEATEIIFKREDKNPTGSWKDRGSAYKLTVLQKEGIKEAVISSSGNAAISLLEYSKMLKDFKLHVVVTPDVNSDKLKILRKLTEGTKHEIHISNEPRKFSAHISGKYKIHNLRSSTDSEILKGYWSLGFELVEFMNKNNQSNKEIGIFVPVSSGTAFVGLTQGLFMRIEQEHLMPRIFACQTEAVHPIVDALSPETSNEQPQHSLADAIIDKTALRSPQILKIIRETDGDALAITNSELQAAKEFAAQKNLLDLSYTSLLSIAGYLKIKDKLNFKKIVCIASGR